VLYNILKIGVIMVENHKYLLYVKNLLIAKGVTFLWDDEELIHVIDGHNLQLDSGGTLDQYDHIVKLYESDSNQDIYLKLMNKCKELEINPLYEYLKNN
jgi:hypothetical protein